jgi:hypothetical protein
MKKSVLILALITLFSLKAYSQDYIIKSDGKEIECKVTEVGITEIKYKLFNNLSGPTISILLSDVIMIRYENGTNQVIEQKQNVTNNQSGISNDPNSYALPVPYKYQNLPRREPYIAALLSAIFPGGGQYYNKQVGKGVAMTLIGATGWGLLIGGISQSYYYSTSSFYDDYDDGYALVVIGSILVTGNSLWSIIDAAVSANNINRSYGLTFEVKGSTYDNLASGRQEAVFGPSLSVRF